MEWTLWTLIILAIILAIDRVLERKHIEKMNNNKTNKKGDEGNE